MWAANCETAEGASNGRALDSRVTLQVFLASPQSGVAVKDPTLAQEGRMCARMTAGGCSRRRDTQISAVRPFRMSPPTTPRAPQCVGDTQSPGRERGSGWEGGTLGPGSTRRQVCVGRPAAPPATGWLARGIGPYSGREESEGPATPARTLGAGTQARAAPLLPSAHGSGLGTVLTTVQLGHGCARSVL